MIKNRGTCSLSTAGVNMTFSNTGVNMLSDEYPPLLLSYCQHPHSPPADSPCGIDPGATWRERHVSGSRWQVSIDPHLPGSSFPRLSATPFWTYGWVYIKVVQLHHMHILLHTSNIWPLFSPFSLPVGGGKLCCNVLKHFVNSLT